MEDKKVKVSLSGFLLIIAIIILITQGYIIYRWDNERKMNQEEIVRLSDEIYNLIEKNNKLEANIDTDFEEEENNEDNILDVEIENNSVKTLENMDLILNGQIIEMDENTKRFDSEKVSFEFPKSWMISQSINENFEEINIISPMASVSSKIMLFNEWYGEEGELKEMLSLDYGSNVLDEGSIKISDCNAYYKEYTFGDGPGWDKQKSILVDLGNSKYYELYFSVSTSDYGYDYSEKELFEIYDEYEAIFDNIISTLKFKK